jgi:hypothetical protein
MMPVWYRGIDRDGQLVLLDDLTSLSGGDTSNLEKAPDWSDGSKRSLSRRTELGESSDVVNCFLGSLELLTSGLLVYCAVY